MARMRSLVEKIRAAEAVKVAREEAERRRRGAGTRVCVWLKVAVSWYMKTKPCH